MLSWARVVRWKNWETGSQRKGIEQIRVGREVGGGGKLGKNLKSEKSEPRVLPEFQNGERDLSCFHMEIGLGKRTLSLSGTETKTKFSEPNTPFNQALKPRRREGRKGRAEGQGGSLSFGLAMEVAIGGIKHCQQLEGKIPSIRRMCSAGL